MKEGLACHYGLWWAINRTRLTVGCADAEEEWYCFGQALLETQVSGDSYKILAT